MHDALEELAAVDERLVRVAEMHYFGGLSEEEVAQVLGVTSRTVRRDKGAPAPGGRVPLAVRPRRGRLILRCLPAGLSLSR